MRRKGWLVVLLMVMVGCLLFTGVVSSTLCKSGCEDKSGCGDCELVAPHTLCGQKGCQRVGPIVINSTGQCQDAGECHGGNSL